MLVKDFDYELPKELIAQYPSHRREESKLLVVHRENQKIEHRKFYDIVDYFTPGDVLVLNETKVIPARLISRRIDTGGKVEVLLLRPCQNVGATFSSEKANSIEWEVLISPGRAKKPGVRVEFGPELWGEVQSTSPKTCFKFYRNSIAGDCPPQSFNTLLHKYGQVPLPPYIKRKPDTADENRYQTVYAKVPGACAAPTAGLHFTHSILNKIREKEVEIAKIVLHTGFGTFKPIKCEKVEEHKMEPEYYEISENSAHKINQANRVIAVGTTTIRTLESASIRSIIKPSKGWTNKFIYPPYKFKVANVLITNFHLPKSTLLLLVSAFASKELIFNAYKEAINRRYRFYSYGDAMLII